MPTEYLVLAEIMLTLSCLFKISCQKSIQLLFVLKLTMLLKITQYNVAYIVVGDAIMTL